MSNSKQTPEIVALILLFLGITVMTIVGFASRSWMPEVASEHGVGVDGVIHYLLISTGTVLVIGTLAMVWFLWRYGRGKPTESPKTSVRTERWWTLVPVLGMALIAEAGVFVKGLPVWEQVYGEAPADALVIEVTAQQFEWIVRYPGDDGEFGRVDPHLVHQTANPAGIDRSDPVAQDDIVVRNQVHIPVGRTIFLRLRSRDVLHSFSVAAFRVKQDIVPGIIGSTKFVATRPGEYEIACAELCGMGHYRMRGTVVVHAADDYQSWIHSQPGWLQ
ncbi:MAG: cytochrome c oxidase subunit II [Gemmatimonadales bacterium]